MSTQALVQADSAATLTITASTVFFALPGATTGTGAANSVQVLASDMKTYFEGGTADEFISTTAIATPSALVATTFIGFASTVSGAALMGFGTTGDVTLKNRAGADALYVVANTTGVVMAGVATVAGATLTLSTAGAAFAIAGTTTALTANVASGAVTIKGNVGTGTGAVGGIIFQVPVTHGSDSVAQTLTTVLTLSATTTVASTFGGPLAITGALTGATTGAFSGTITVTGANPMVGTITTDSTLFSTIQNNTATTAHILEYGIFSSGSNSGAAFIGSQSAHNFIIVTSDTVRATFAAASGAVTWTGAHTGFTAITSSALTINGAVQLGTAAGADVITIGGTAYGAGVASVRFNGLTTAATNNLTGTLTNSPVTGNPTFWMPVSIAGVVKYQPLW